MLADRDGRLLSDGLIRLHVVARSDSPEDQAEKLQLRDRALALLSPQLAECGSLEEAAALIDMQLPALEALGDVRASLTREYYPTRQYNTFALPAGEYLSLRLVLGEGAGHNWWCVIFPPLCTEALAGSGEDTDAFLSLNGDVRQIITADGPEYQLRFRIADWWGRLREWITTGAWAADPAAAGPVYPQ